MTAIIDSRSGRNATQPRVYGHFIDGAFTTPSGNLVDRRAPATGEVVVRTARGSVQETERAIAAARHAFDEGGWPRLSGMDRGRALMRLAQAMRDEAPVLAEIEAEETGKPIRLARSDVEGSAGLTEYAASLAMSMHGDVHTNLGRDFTGLVTREPAGVVGLITPWNFPLLLLAQKLPFALAAGCTTIAKPSELTPSTTLEVARLCKQAGIPDGAYNVVTGQGSVVGQTIAESPLVDMVSFTGSTAVGRSIVEASKGNLKRVSLELGGKSANIVFDDADLADALDGVMFGVYFNNGECCVSGSRLLIQDTVADEFMKALVERVRRLKVGNPLDESTDIGPMIHADHMAAVLDYVVTATEEGAAVLAGGERQVEGALAQGLYIAPTIIDSVQPGTRVFREEIFGPVLAVTRFSTVEEAIKIANDTNYGLANSVWTKNIDRALRIAAEVRSGTVWINTTIDGAPQLPGGGIKESGYGREMGQVGFDEFTEVKTIQIRTGKRNPFYTV